MQACVLTGNSEPGEYMDPARETVRVGGRHPVMVTEPEKEIEWKGICQGGRGVEKGEPGKLAI